MPCHVALAEVDSEQLKSFSLQRGFPARIAKRRKAH
jgi:hypothetical protein